MAEVIVTGGGGDTPPPGAPDAGDNAAVEAQKNTFREKALELLERIAEGVLNLNATLEVYLASDADDESEPDAIEQARADAIRLDAEANKTRAEADAKLTEAHAEAVKADAKAPPVVDVVADEPAPVDGLENAEPIADAPEEQEPAAPRRKWFKI